MFILPSFFPPANVEMLRGTVTKLLLTNYLCTNSKAYILPHVLNKRRIRDVTCNRSIHSFTKQIVPSMYEESLT